MPAVRPLAERDLPEAQRIVRTAFGTFFGAPDLDSFWTDFDYVYGRHGAEHTASFAIDEGGRLAGSNFATRWGSVGFFGPLSTRPDLWNRGFAQPLVAAASDAFDRWRLSHAGLCTFPQSTKHIHLYQKFGFYPRFLSAIMTAPAGSGEPLSVGSRYSSHGAGERRDIEAQCADVTGTLYEGLDLAGEIRTATARRLGDTLLLWEGPSRLAGFAVCHWGPASEAGADRLYIKFGAVRTGASAGNQFSRLLDSAAALAREASQQSVVAGVSLAREEAYRLMCARGFRSQMQVVTLHRPNEPGYSRPGAFAIDDWR
jgi:hypothetical protein